MRVVLDTCVLKLATLPNPINPAALIAELGLRRSIELCASPAIVVEYDVLGDTPEFLARLIEVLELWGIAPTNGRSLPNLRHPTPTHPPASPVA